MKKCNVCNLEKTLESFGRDSTRPGGLSPRCRACSCAEAALRRSKTADKRAAMNKAWREKNRTNLLAKKKEWRQSNKGKANASFARYMAARDDRTPAWADLEKIAAVYLEAARIKEETGEDVQVDHEIPLRGKLVSGLHVHNNLKIIPAVENNRKGNNWTPT